MQRLHIDDLTGHLLKQDGWELLSLPAITEKDEFFTLSEGRIVGRTAGSALNPKLQPIEELEKLKKIMSDSGFSAQYQQSPIPPEGNILDFKKFQFFNDLPPEGRIIQSWDIALKTGANNDYSVGITALVNDKKVYILDIFRDKLDFTNLVNKIKELQLLYQAQNVIIEDSSISISLLQKVKESDMSIIEYKPDCAKEVRANNASWALSAGDVYLKKDAHWLEEFKKEIITFPMGVHDDQVDAFTQLIATIDKTVGSYSCGTVISSDMPMPFDKMKGYQGLEPDDDDMQDLWDFTLGDLTDDEAEDDDFG